MLPPIRTRNDGSQATAEHFASLTILAAWPPTAGEFHGKYPIGSAGLAKSSEIGALSDATMPADSIIGRS